MFRTKNDRRVSAAIRRQKEIGGFNKDVVETYIKRITNDGERKNSKMIANGILKEVEVLKRRIHN